MESAGNKQDRERAAEVTALLGSVRAGEPRAWGALLERVESELRILAHRQMLDERTGHLLQTTALVNEAYMRLVQGPTNLENRAQFFAVSASAMRHVLVDEARKRRALKRGGGAEPVTISQLAEACADTSNTDADVDLEALDRALARFEADEHNTKKSKLVELRFFTGLTLEQAAEVLGVSLATVKRDWEFARAWLKREMARAEHAG